MEIIFLASCSTILMLMMLTREELPNMSISKQATEMMMMMMMVMLMLTREELLNLSMSKQATEIILMLMLITRVELLNMSMSKQATEIPPALLRQLEEITHIVRRSACS